MRAGLPDANTRPESACRLAQTGGFQRPARSLVNERSRSTSKRAEARHETLVTAVKTETGGRVDTQVFPSNNKIQGSDPAAILDITSVIERNAAKVRAPAAAGSGSPEREVARGARESRFVVQRRGIRTVPKEAFGRTGDLSGAGGRCSRPGLARPSSVADSVSPSQPSLRAPRKLAAVSSVRRPEASAAA